MSSSGLCVTEMMMMSINTRKEKEDEHNVLVHQDWKLVNSISATERVALWEKFSGPVDQHAIKVDFIRRARNPRPAFRSTICLRITLEILLQKHFIT